MQYACKMHNYKANVYMHIWHYYEKQQTHLPFCNQLCTG